MIESSVSPETEADSAPPISTEVVERIAAATDREAMQLPPLYDAIDPDALETVVGSVPTESSRFEIRFEYAGCLVSIDGTGAIDIEHPER